jgi:hypothetical protein
MHLTYNLYTIIRIYITSCISYGVYRRFFFVLFLLFDRNIQSNSMGSKTFSASFKKKFSEREKTKNIYINLSYTNIRVPYSDPSAICCHLSRQTRCDLLSLTLYICVSCIIEWMVGWRERDEQLVSLLEVVFLYDRLRSIYFLFLLLERRTRWSFNIVQLPRCMIPWRQEHFL